MPSKKLYQKPKTLQQARRNFRYRGKIVIEAKGKIFAARTGENAQKILDNLRKKYPQETPKITYIPKSGTVLVPTPLEMEK